MTSSAADPINYGWPEEEGRLLPVMLPQNVALVPDDTMWLYVSTSLLDCKM